MSTRTYDEQIPLTDPMNVNPTPPPPIDTLSLHDALPICQILRHPRASPKCRRESTPEALGCFGTTDRVGERPRRWEEHTAEPQPRPQLVDGVHLGTRRRGSPARSAAWRPEPVAPHRAAETNKSKLAAPDSSAPTREPEMPERKHARGPRLFWRDRSRWRATP